MPVVTAQTFARAFFGKTPIDGQMNRFGGGSHEAFRLGVDGKNVPTFSSKAFWGATANTEESMGKRAGDFNISRSRGTVTAAITLLTAFIGLLIERVCKCISSYQKEDAVTQAVVDLQKEILEKAHVIEGPGTHSVSIGLKHGGELEVSEDTGANGTVLTITVKTGETSESFAIEDCDIDALKSLLEREIVMHEADDYRYGEAIDRIPQARRDWLAGRSALREGEDLGGVDLRGVDLRGVDLREANLGGANLSGVDLSRVDLYRADLREADLSGAKLHGAKLSKADLRGADLREADLSGAKLHGAKLSKADLREADLYGVDLSGVDLSGATLSEANLRGAALREANLSGVDLRGFDLSGVDLSGAKLTGAKLSEANLRGAALCEANLSGVDLRGFDLSGVDLSGVDLSGVDLSEANLRGAKLRRVDLRGAQLRRVDLRGVDLCGAKLRGAKLDTANLIGAKLRGVDLRRADLCGANLTGANLSGADLSGADLSGVNLSLVDMRATTLAQTTFSLETIIRRDLFTDEMLSKITFSGLSADLRRPEARDVLFNHRNNPRSGSILTAIDARLGGDRKIQCMEVAIKALDDVMSAGVNDPDVQAVVTEFLLAHPEYQDKSVSINSFVQKMLPRLFSSYQDVSFPVESWPLSALKVMLGHAQTQLTQPEPEGYAWARENSFSLLQILDAAERHEELGERASALRETYLSVLPDKLKRFVTISSELMCEPESSYFPLLAKEMEVCILLTKDGFKNGMRAPDEPGEELSNVFVAVDWSRMPDESSGKPDELVMAKAEFHPLFNQTHLAQFRVLHAQSISRLSSQSLEKIVKAVIPSEYVEGYMIGAAGRASQKWTTPQAQVDLKRFILPLVGHDHDDFVEFKTFSNARFQKGLLEQLFAEAEAVHGALTDAEKAFFLRSHAAALSYASSSLMFGEELDSPEGLRVLAVAMLNHADDLDPNVKGFSKDELVDHKGRLLGERKLLTCTKLLSGKLQEALRDQAKNNIRLEAIYTAALPAKWRQY
ncbi:pentapeptide repeat-containing protein [Caballeronia sp. EK]|uniref:pentapeptide repeat-containing protein n=1 Tax=Caballeronia sp. EK TaxID=2767469 RepID=UPI001656519B|nr:pentapeptide repeat-containing protein [Caballeronia sp. EK]MBC8643023.1 pentapeptide repeat-containing protein [Caballeronia sp. EK]